MLTMIILACHIGVISPTDNPSKCKTFKNPIYEQNMSPMMCMMQAPPILAKFEEEHPNWKVHKWSCKNLLTDSTDV